MRSLHSAPLDFGGNLRKGVGETPKTDSLHQGLGAKTKLTWSTCQPPSTSPFALTCKR